MGAGGGRVAGGPGLAGGVAGTARAALSDAWGSRWCRTRPGRRSPGTGRKVCRPRRQRPAREARRSCRPRWAWTLGEQEIRVRCYGAW